jgi:hypothetical protein
MLYLWTIPNAPEAETLSSRIRFLAALWFLCLVVAPTGRAQITEIIDATGDGGGNVFDDAETIIVDGSGNVYVVGAGSDNAFKITPGGTITEIIDATGDGGGNTLDEPSDIAVDGAGTLYVTGRLSDNAFEITAGGAITEIIDATGDGGANTLAGASGIAVDGLGNVYVAGYDSHNLFKITPGGTITEIVNQTGDYQHPLFGSSDVAVDGAGNVYLAGLLSNNVFVIPGGAFGSATQIIGATGDFGANQLTSPFCIAVDGPGNVYVAGYFSHNAFMVTSGGAITAIIDATGDGGAHPLDRPVGIALDGSGNAYVAGSDTDDAFKITPGGVITQIIDPTGDGGGNTLDRSWGITVDGSGNVYVTGRRSNNAFKIAAAPVTFCDDSDGSLASCPCANPGAPDTGCDIQQSTGGVGLSLVAQETSPLNRVTWGGSGFPAMSTPTSIVIRAADLDSAAPVVFGDGLRCVGTPLVRLGAAFAIGGTSVHTHGHGAMAGTGAFRYQLWFRNTPVMFCDPTAAFNLSNGHTLVW